MAEQGTRYTFDRVVRLVLGAITLAAVFALLRYLSDVLIPFAAAVVLAYLLNPLVRIFERKTKRRWAAVAMTLGGLLTMGLTVMVLILPLMYGQVNRFGRNLSKLRDDLDASRRETAVEAVPPTTTAEPGAKSAVGWRELQEAWAEYQRDAGSQTRSERLRELRDQLSGTLMGELLDRAAAYVKSEQFSNALVELAKRAVAGGWSALSFAVHFVIALSGLIIVGIYLVFLLLDFPEYARTWKSFLPPTYRTPIVEFLTEFDQAMRRYFRGQSIVALITGLLYAVGFTLIGLPMALPLAMFIGLLSMVPYLALSAVVPGVLFAVARSVEGDASLAGSLMLLFLVIGLVQTIQDTLVTPRVMGKATGLKPVMILLGVFIWGKLLGALGILLAIPLTCLGIAYYRRYVLLQTVSHDLATNLEIPPAPE